MSRSAAKRFFRFRPRTFIVLTLLLLLFLGFIRLYPFLARHAPVPSDTLVLEGWVADDQLEQTLQWADANQVKTIYLTGGPITLGSWLAEWKTLPEMTLARINAMELTNDIAFIAVPAEKVRRDRTWASALALQKATGLTRGSFNLASTGPHTRRSWLTFRRAFGDGVDIGSIALTPTEYDRSDWWKCSDGVRAMIGETIAYLYYQIRKPARPHDSATE